jgi:hypothetical protein
MLGPFKNTRVIFEAPDPRGPHYQHLVIEGRVWREADAHGFCQVNTGPYVIPPPSDIHRIHRNLLVW